MYVLFETKKDLFAAAAEAEAARFTDTLIAAQETTLDEPAAVRTRARYAALFRYASDRPDGFRLLTRIREQRDGTVDPIIDEARATLFDGCPISCGSSSQASASRTTLPLRSSPPSSSAWPSRPCGGRPSTPTSTVRRWSTC